MKEAEKDLLEVYKFVVGYVPSQEKEALKALFKAYADKHIRGARVPSPVAIVPRPRVPVTPNSGRRETIRDIANIFPDEYTLFCDFNEDGYLCPKKRYLDFMAQRKACGSVEYDGNQYITYDVGATHDYIFFIKENA